MRPALLSLHELDELSSPDPLANSTNDRLPVATRSPTRSPSPPKRRLSLPARASRSKQSLHISSSPRSTHSFATYPVSPSRTVTEHNLSPWKLRVTVEAQHEDGEQGGETTTRTIKVPLRDESSPLPQDANSTRGRRAEPSSARTRRSGTPVRRRNGSASRTRRQSITDLNIAPLGDDGEGDEWSPKKKTPRKKRTSRTQRAQSEQSDGRLPDDDSHAQNVSQHDGRQAPQKNTPFEIHEDQHTEWEAAHGAHDQGSDSHSPELRQIDLNRVSVRQHPQSNKRKEGQAQWSDANPPLEPSPKPIAQRNRKVSETSAMSYPTPSPSTSYHGSDEVEKAAEPIDEPEHYDTIMESEGFTMIDLDTVPSARRFFTSPEERNSEQANDGTRAPIVRDIGTRTPQSKTMSPSQSRKKPTPIPSYLMVADDESELSSNVPSSPPAADTSLLMIPSKPRAGTRKVTPVTYSSPSLPPPPPPQKVVVSSSRPEAPPEEVLNAGMALQDAVTSDDSGKNSSGHRPSSRTPSSPEGDFFDGFSSGTKRELRAGLRFGEELAKRHKSSLESSQAAVSLSADGPPMSRIGIDKMIVKSQTNTQIWRGETTVQHSPFAIESHLQIKRSEHVRSPDGRLADHSLLSRESMAPKVSSEKKSSQSQTPKTSLTGSKITQLGTTAKLEHKWQLERDAVSREIEDASPSNVIVIDSDDDGEESEDGTRSTLAGRADHPGHRQKTANRSRKFAREEEDSLREGAGAGEEDGQIGRSFEEVAKRIPLITAQMQDAGSCRPNTQEGAVDSDHGEEEDGDIWLQEAQENSSSPREQDAPGLFTRTEQRRQWERATEVVNKPRRSLLPSPWKRGEDVAEASTFMSNGEISSLFFHQQPQEVIKFGAGEMARQKRQLSGLNLEKMLSSPMKLAAVGRKNLTLRKSDEHEKLNQQAESDSDPEDGDILDEAEDHSDASVASSQLESAVGAESLEHTASSPLPPQTIPVNFNDSTMSAGATSPRQGRSTPTDDAEMARLTPPRSALKGARLSFSPQKPAIHSDARRVVFSERSLYLNSDGEESSMSANLDSPLPEPKSAEQLHEAGPEQEAKVEEDDTPKPNRKSSWLNWVWRGNVDESTGTLEESTVSIPKLDGTDEAHASVPNSRHFELQNNEAIHEDETGEESDLWQPAKLSLPSTNTVKNHSNGHHREPKHQENPKLETETHQQPPHTKNPQPPSPAPPPPSNSKLPSYLLSPSYPSDPTRNPSIPLSTSGEFTNTHFRTLHILHLKSQRPRFHAPKRIRREVKRLLGWKLDVDETPANLGGFQWTVGTNEMQVLERFMQEIEFGRVSVEKEGGGMVDGKGRVRVEWGWTVEELAKYLGMVVVGEAVRGEEGRVQKMG